MYSDIFSTDMQEYTRVPWKVQNIYPKYSKAYFGFIVHVDLFFCFCKVKPVYRTSPSLAQEAAVICC